MSAGPPVEQDPAGGGGSWRVFEIALPLAEDPGKVILAARSRALLAGTDELRAHPLASVDELHHLVEASTDQSRYPYVRDKL